MSHSSTKISRQDMVPVTIRPECLQDEIFLLDLYASTRQEELALTNWNAAARTAFIQMQFNAMRQGYAHAFPAAQFSIIQSGDNPIGRIIVNRTATEIRLIDIAILPEYLGRGIGTDLLQQLLVEANEYKKPLRLQVLKMNRAARLYERLGFLRISEDDFYDQLEWRPTAALAADFKPA